MTYSFETYIPEARAQLLGYARSLTRNDPEDLVQETFAKALTYWADGNFVQFISWAKQTLYTTFIDRERRQETQEHNLPLLTASLRRIARLAGEDDVEAVEGCRSRDVNRAWAALTENHRSVLHSIAFDGLTYKQAAAAHQIEIGTVMSRVARARETMQRYIEEGVPA